jgi:hypothetical protein
MATAREVAEWMTELVLSQNYLEQEQVVYEIATKFGDEHVYQNENGNLAISPKVLREFRKLTEATVVWEGGEKLWRKRTADDNLGRRVAD